MTWRPAQPDDALLANELVRIGIGRDKRATAAFVLSASGLFTLANIGELLGTTAEGACRLCIKGASLMKREWYRGHRFEHAEYMAGLTS